jgi:CheY-like chemotaxis protein
MIGEAATGAEAVEIAAKEQPDVLLMDIRMPGMDGIEATRQITGSDRSAGVRILILTTFDLDEYVYAALRTGASGFLLKDTPPADLLARYASDIHGHIVPAIGRYRLDKLRPAHLVTLYNAKAAEGMSGASLRHMHAVIRRALNVAVRWQLLASNPATLVDAPKAAQHEITPLTAAEARRLIQAAEGDRMQARWLVGLALGAPGRGARPVVGGR